jgi:hypothetical protein
MGVFARFGAWLIQLFVPIFIEKIGGAIKGWIAARAARKAVEDAAKKSVQKLKDAKTGKEIDAGIDDSLDHF